MRLRWPHIHRWRLAHDTGLHFYYECRCGNRKVRRAGFGGYQPVDTHWLEGGEWNRPLRPPAKTTLVPLDHGP